jgi:von Hippel-Lindau disease tumor supressor
MAEEKKEYREVRSLNNDITTYVRFKNRCDRQATLYWFNFQGNLVRYAILKKGEYIDMITYVTHPWCAKEVVSNDRLVINKESVYYPTEGEEEVYKLVLIDLPGMYRPLKYPILYH